VIGGWWLTVKVLSILGIRFFVYIFWERVCELKSFFVLFCFSL
jgi:hypothetical protein